MPRSERVKYIQPVQGAQPLPPGRLIQPVQPTQTVQRVFRSKCVARGTVACPPFGVVPSCMSASLSKLSAMLSVVDSLAPGCSALCFQSCSFKDWERHISTTFEHTSSALTDASYHTYSSHLTSITLCIKHLETSLLLRRQISSHLSHHSLTSTVEVLKLLNNLEQLYEVLQPFKSGIQQRFWNMLDSDAQASARKLRCVMKSAASRKQDEPLVKHISWRHFANLGVSQWLDDEIINHFVEKWSRQSTVLGLSSFFPVKFLFETDDCETAVDLEVVVCNDQYQSNVLKWVQKCQKRQNVDRFDQLFIPINGRKRHWYSACIDYARKRIDIYDSLREVCISNRSKPAQERQNAKLMLMLMWTANAVGLLRGESADSLDVVKPGAWKFDPHAVVPFQPNQHDCGMHTLWHLKHLVEFGRILGKAKDIGPLSFTNDMVGKRLRLAHELVEEST